jgi:hypothetical protein
MLKLNILRLIDVFLIVLCKDGLARIQSAFACCKKSISLATKKSGERLFFPYPIYLFFKARLVIQKGEIAFTSFREFFLFYSYFTLFYFFLVQSSLPPVHKSAGPDSIPV